MMAHPIRPPPVKAQSDVTDERCWTRTKQTNARRALGLEPVTSSFCYLNFRNAVGAMSAVPGRPGTFIAQPAAPLPEPFLDNPPAPEGTTLPAYHWPWLDGRYFYYARGRENVDRHAREMGQGDWREGLEVIEDRIEKRLEEDQGREATEQRMKAKALGLPDPRAESYENLIPLSELWSTSLRRLHLHVLRIYSPGLRNLARLPDVYRDGTATQMLGTVQTKLTDGSALALVDRMWNATCDVAKQIKARRDRIQEGGGGEGPGGPPGLGPGPSPFGGLGGGRMGGPP